MQTKPHPTAPPPVPPIPPEQITAVIALLTDLLLAAVGHGPHVPREVHDERQDHR